MWRRELVDFESAVTLVLAVVLIVVLIVVSNAESAKVADPQTKNAGISRAVAVPFLLTIFECSRREMLMI
jgi:hypothetical protein